MPLTTLALVITASCQAFDDDMQKYLSDTKEMVRQGKHEESLERFIWFHDHALEHDPAMYGVRLSFALMYWKQLGDVYPPALAALKQIRDDKTATIKSGEGNRHLFHDVMALNRTLDENVKTVELFQQLDEKQKRLASECWDIAKDAVIAGKQYDLARKYLGNPLREFRKVKAMYAQNVTLYDSPQVGGVHFKTYNENKFVEESLTLIEVSLAFGDTQAARAIQKKALAVLADDRIRNAIPKRQVDKAQQGNDGDGLKPAP